MGRPPKRSSRPAEGAAPAGGIACVAAASTGRTTWVASSATGGTTWVASAAPGAFPPGGSTVPWSGCSVGCCGGKGAVGGGDAAACPAGGARGGWAPLGAFHAAGPCWGPEGAGERRVGEGGGGGGRGGGWRRGERERGGGR